MYDESLTGEIDRLHVLSELIAVIFSVPEVEPWTIVTVVDKSPDNVTVIADSTAEDAVAVIILCVAVTVIVFVGFCGIVSVLELNK